MLKYLKKLIRPFYHFFCFYFTNYIVSYIPFRFVRKLWLKGIMRVKSGRKTYLDMAIYYLAPWRLNVGNNTHINRGCFLDARGIIKIGNSVSISHNVSLITGSHKINSSNFEYEAYPIEIADFCFVGANVTILNNVKVGKGAIICAGAVVVKDIEPYSVVAGIPAKKIGMRNNSEYNYKCNPNSFFI